MSLFVLALALTVATSAPAQAVPTPPHAPAIDPARRARGVELARMFNNEKTAQVQAEKMLNETFPAVFAADPEIKALEKDYPGIIKAMIEAMRPIVIDEAIGTMPQLWERLGPVYAEELTMAELDEAIAFFRTPVGERLIEGMAREVDFSQMAQGLLADDEAKISETSIRAGLTAGAVKTARKLSPEDSKSITNFGWTSAGAKLRGAQTRIMPIVAEWSNKTSPAADARMEIAMTAVVEKFIGKDAKE